MFEAVHRRPDNLKNFRLQFRFRSFQTHGRKEIRRFAVRARSRSYPALVSLKTEAERSRYRVGDIMVPGQLAVVADGSRYLRSDLYSKVSLYNQAIMAQVGSV